MGDGDHVEQNAAPHVLLAVVRFGEWKTYLNFVKQDIINIVVEVAFDTSRVDIPLFLSTAQHLPIGHRLRPIAIPNLRYVPLHGHGMGQRVYAATKHDRILLVQIQPGDITAVGTFNETDGIPHAKSERKQW